MAQGRPRAASITSRRLVREATPSRATPGAASVSSTTWPTSASGASTRRSSRRARASRDTSRSPPTRNVPRVGPRPEKADGLLDGGGPRRLGGLAFERRGRSCFHRDSVDPGPRLVGPHDLVGESGGIDRATRELVEGRGHLAEQGPGVAPREGRGHRDERLEERAPRRRIVGKPDPRRRTVLDADPVPTEVVRELDRLGERPEQRSHRAVDDLLRVAGLEGVGTHERQRDVHCARTHVHLGSSRAAAKSRPCGRRGGGALEGPHEERGLAHDRHPELRRMRQGPVERRPRPRGDDRGRRDPRSDDTQAVAAPDGHGVGFRSTYSPAARPHVVPSLLLRLDTTCRAGPRSPRDRSLRGVDRALRRVRRRLRGG